MTKVPHHLVKDSKSAEAEQNYEAVLTKGREQHDNKGYMKWVILGGAVALACTIDRGAVGKFLVFGVARRLGRVGRRL